MRTLELPDPEVNVPCFDHVVHCQANERREREDLQRKAGLVARVSEITVDAHNRLMKKKGEEELHDKGKSPREQEPACA